MYEFSDVSSFEATPDVSLTAMSGLNACPGDHVTLICEVRGHHPVLAWSADHPYIASVQPLQFSSSSKLNDQKQDQGRNDTVATLINKTGNGSNAILQSVLSLTVSSDYRSFNVTCTGTDGKNRTVTINVPRKPKYSFSTIMIYLFFPLYSCSCHTTKLSIQTQLSGIN